MAISLLVQPFLRHVSLEQSKRSMMERRSGVGALVAVVRVEGYLSEADPAKRFRHGVMRLGTHEQLMPSCGFVFLTLVEKGLLMAR
jgi:hypothetical protein